jgi:anti-sigma factor RsiW
MTHTHPHSEAMTCRELIELVTDYIEGALPSSERERFEAHLGACPHCVIYVEQTRTTAATVRRLGGQSLSPAARDALLGAFRDWKAGDVV